LASRHRRRRPDTFKCSDGLFVASNGDVFVSDGHGGDTNARIVKFSKEGKFIAAWGKRKAAARGSLPAACVGDGFGRPPVSSPTAGQQQHRNLRSG